MKSIVVPMHCSALYILAVALSTTAIADEKPADKPLEAGFVALFDGKSFDGWEGSFGLFSHRTVKYCRVAQRDIPNNEFLCTEKQYSDFELRLEVKLQGAGNNAGVQFRSARVPDDQ